MKCEYGHDPVADPGAMCQSCEGILMTTPNPYCSEHEWPAGMPKPCPDCGQRAYFEGRIKTLVAERDAALLQLGEALKACPWATHATNHTEPKHCIAAIHSQCEILGDERRGLAEQLKESNRLNREQGQLLSKCLDVFARFAGGPIIAHPPKCRFYIEGREKDCTCKAKDLMNDVLLTLKDLRANLESQQPEKRICEECGDPEKFPGNTGLCNDCAKKRFL